MAWWCITSAAKTATFAPLNSNISTVEIINCPPFFDSLDICELEIHVVVGSTYNGTLLSKARQRILLADSF